MMSISIDSAIALWTTASKSTGKPAPSESDSGRAVRAVTPATRLNICFSNTGATNEYNGLQT